MFKHLIRGALALVLLSGTAWAQNTPVVTSDVPYVEGMSMPLTQTTGGRLRTDAASLSVVSTANSSTTPLAGAGVFTGTAVSLLGAGSISVTAISNVASATDGLSVQQSPDGTNWDVTDVYTVGAGSNINVLIPVKAAWGRVVYTNAAGAQASFRLQTTLKPQMPVASAVRPANGASIQNDFPVQLSLQELFNGTSRDLAASIQGAAATGLGTMAVAEAPTSGAAAATATAQTTVAAGSLVAKASAGNLYGVSANLPTGAIAQKLMVFNATSAPADGTVTPLRVYDVPAAGSFDIQFHPPIRASTGITLVLSTTGPFSKTIALTTNLGFLAAEYQ